MTHRSKSAHPAMALAEAMATRLCHDLAGTVGTIAGALDLAGDAADAGAEALPVAREAAESLGQRLRFMRAAWGGDSVEMNLAEFSGVALGLPVGRRVSVSLAGLAPGRQFSADAARLLLNLLLVGVEALAGEGVLQVQEAMDGDVVIRIDGPRAAWPEGFAGQLADADVAVTAAAHSDPRRLAAPLAALVAHAAGRRVTMLLGPHSTAAPPLVAALG